MAKTAKRLKPQKKTGRSAKTRKAAPAPSARERAAARVALPAPRGRGKLERVRVPAQTAKSSTGEPVSAADPNEGKYVYCVIKSERPLNFGMLGIGPEPAEVHTVHFRDIAAIVSNTPMVVQDPTRDNVLAHHRVNETVMKQHTVIPMSFG